MKRVNKKISTAFPVILETEKTKLQLPGKKSIDDIVKMTSGFQTLNAKK